ERKENSRSTADRVVGGTRSNSHQNWSGLSSKNDFIAAHFPELSTSPVHATTIGFPNTQKRRGCVTSPSETSTVPNTSCHDSPIQPLESHSNVDSSKPSPRSIASTTSRPASSASALTARPTNTEKYWSVLPERTTAIPGLVGVQRTPANTTNDRAR